MEFPYEDLLNAERPISKRRAPIDLITRSAQFAPFAALQGFEALLSEKNREAQLPRETTEQEQAALNRILSRLAALKGPLPEVLVDFYGYDPATGHGSYRRIRTRIHRIDSANSRIILSDGSCIRLPWVQKITVIR